MKYFTIPEMCASATANRYGISNVPGDLERQNLQALIENVLDPIRERWGGPVLVTSGYRCPKLNSKVGGVSNSWHVKGLAADLQVRAAAGITQKNRIKLLFQQIRDNIDIPFERLLLEHDSKGVYWVHIQYDPLSARPRRLVIDNYFSTR